MSVVFLSLTWRILLIVFSVLCVTTKCLQVWLNVLMHCVERDGLDLVSCCPFAHGNAVFGFVSPILKTEFLFFNDGSKQSEKKTTLQTNQEERTRGGRVTHAQHSFRNCQPASSALSGPPLLQLTHLFIFSVSAKLTRKYWLWALFVQTASGTHTS